MRLQTVNKSVGLLRTRAVLARQLVVMFVALWSVCGMIRATAATLPEVVEAGQYDRWVADFGDMAEQAVELALSKGYYLTLSQQRQHGQLISERFTRQSMADRLLAELKPYQNQPAVNRALRWYSSGSGKKALAQIKRSYPESSLAELAPRSRALLADPMLVEWWEFLEARDQRSWFWLELKQEVLLDTVATLAKQTRPFTPFDRQQIQTQVQSLIFNTRPDVERFWQLRFINAARQLDVTERLDYQDFSRSKAEADFIQLVKRASQTVVQNSQQELDSLIRSLRPSDSA